MNIKINNRLLIKLIYFIFLFGVLDCISPKVKNIKENIKNIQKELSNIMETFSNNEKSIINKRMSGHFQYFQKIEEERWLKENLNIIVQELDPTEKSEFYFISQENNKKINQIENIYLNLLKYAAKLFQEQKALNINNQTHQR